MPACDRASATAPAAAPVAPGRAGNAATRTADAGRRFNAANGTGRYSPTYNHARALDARNWYAGRGWFTPGWVGGHPLAWYPAGYGAAAWATAGWGMATWGALGGWFGWDVAPMYYNYGDNIVYQDDDVYYGDQMAATAEDYYQQASDLAGTGGTAPQQGAQWLPLGVFSVVEGDQQQPALTLQLAVDKQGVIRGNAIQGTTDTTLAVSGAVDKTTQRAAWTIGDDKNTVYETGLYNLTTDEATGLVHFRSDKTEQMLLVRLKQDQQSEQVQPAPTQQ